jgi:hypothetical protein
LDLNGIERVIIHLSVSENYGFDTIISGYYLDSVSKINISYSENHESTLMSVLYYDDVSLLPTHAHIIAGCI